MNNKKAMRSNMATRMDLINELPVCADWYAIAAMIIDTNISSAAFPMLKTGFGLQNAVNNAQRPNINSIRSDGDFKPRKTDFGPQKKIINIKTNNKMEISTQALEPLSGFKGFPPGIQRVRAKPMSRNSKMLW